MEKQTPGKECTGAYLTNGLEEFSSEFLEGFLLILGLGSDDRVEIVAKVLRPETEVVLDIWPGLLIYEFLHIYDVLC